MYTLWGGPPEWIKNSLEVCQWHYWAQTVTTLLSSVLPLPVWITNKTVWSHSLLALHYGWERPKTICRLNGNICCHSLFPIFFFFPCIPQSSVPYFSSSITGSSVRRKRRKKSQRTVVPLDEFFFLHLYAWRFLWELLSLIHCLMLLGYWQATFEI